jgi:hypothetical protein
LKSILVILNLLACLTIYSQETYQKFPVHVENLTFDEFARIVELGSGIDIFYKREWVRDVRVSLDSDSITALDALLFAVKGTGLKVSEWNRNFILMPGEELISSLPDFSSGRVPADSTVYETGESDRQFLMTRSSDLLRSITVGQRKAGRTEWADIEGVISDIENGEPVVGATIYLVETKTGSVTDGRGRLSLHLRPGTYTASFNCMGYKKMACQLIVNSNGRFQVELVKDIIPIEEAVVYGDRQMMITSKDPGIEKIIVKSIKEIPMMLGERDILKVSEMLPGIVSVGEGSSGLNVRGGNFDQNAFYINNVPVYNTSHFFGFFPAFNADVIKDFTIYKGHVPARFGGKLSSVFDIETRQGSRDRFSMHGGINPISGNLTVSGPLITDSCTYLLSGRASYSDWILTRIDDYLIQNSSAGFNDVTASITCDLKKNSVNLFLYQSSDCFSLADLISYEYSNLGGALNLHHRISPSLRDDFSMVGSMYSYGTVDQQEVSAAYKHSYRLHHFELRNDLTQILHRKHTLNYGIDLTLYLLDRGSLEPYGEGSLKSPVHHGKEQGLSGGLYLSDEYEILPWLNLSAGFRFSLYSYLGPRQVFIYAESDRRDARLITDTLDFGAGEIIKWYSAPQLRLALNVATDPNGSVKLSFNQMYQPLFMLSNTIALAPNTQWKLSDYHLNPSKGNQYSAGVFRTFLGHRIEGSVEAFYKRTRNFPEFRDGANFLSNPVVETDVLQGVQKSYGIEFFIKMNGRNADGWIAYTYSRSFIKVDGNNIWNKINQGVTYPSNYDIPNALNALFNYHFSKRVTASGVLTYQTGKPVTYPVSVYTIEDQPYVDFSSRNKYRIPDYFRVDLSVNVEGNLRRNKLLHSSWQFSVYNLTGRANAYSVYYLSEDGKLKSYKYSIIGTQLFTVSWLIKIGNLVTE